MAFASLSWTDFLIASVGGVLICVSTSLNFLIWGTKEIITEQFFGLWTKNETLFDCSSKTGSFGGLIPDKHLIAIEMRSRRRATESEDSIMLLIDLWRRFLCFTCTLLVSAAFGIIHFEFVHQHKASFNLFQLPSEYISQLSVVGFAISGFLVGTGNHLCRGGLLYHSVCGIPSNSARSWLVVLLVLLFTGLTQFSKKYVFASLLSTETLYVKHLDDSIYWSCGFLSTSFCVLMVVAFVFCFYVNKLRNFLKEKKCNVNS